MNNKALRMAAASATILIFATATLPASPADAAAVLVPGVAGVGAGGDFGGDNMAIEPGLGAMTCEGAYIIVVACTASVTGAVQECIPVEGSFLGIGFHAEVCAGVGVAACASGTAAVAIAQRLCAASAVAQKANATVERKCEYNGYVHDYVVWECHDEVTENPKTDSDFRNCVESNNYVLEGVNETLQHPLSPEVPAWHARVCPAKASQTSYLCVDLDASSYAKADLWDVSDESHMPGCRARGNTEPGARLQPPSAGISGEGNGFQGNPIEYVCSMVPSAVCVTLYQDPATTSCHLMRSLTDSEDCPPSVSADPAGFLCDARFTPNGECPPDLGPESDGALAFVCDLMGGDYDDSVINCTPDPGPALDKAGSKAEGACEAAKESLDGILESLMADTKIVSLRGSRVNCTTARQSSQAVPMSRLSEADQQAIRATLMSRLESALDQSSPTVSVDPNLPLGSRDLMEEVWNRAHDDALSAGSEALAQDFYVLVVPGDN